MVSGTLVRTGILVCACLALGVLCGFALPVPEEWLARDPGFSITRRLWRRRRCQRETSPSFRRSPALRRRTPWSPSSSPDRKRPPKGAVFLCPAIKPGSSPL